MAPLPKRKRSKAHRGGRRSQVRLSLPATELCPQCHNLKPCHHVCPSCGSYNGKEVIKVKSSKKR